MSRPLTGLLLFTSREFNEYCLAAQYAPPVIILQFRIISINFALYEQRVSQPIVIKMYTLISKYSYRLASFDNSVFPVFGLNTVVSTF